MNIYFITLLKRKLFGDILYINTYRNRINKLISRGLKIGKNVTIETTVVFDEGYPYLIKIGNNVSIASHVRILTHDDTLYKFNGGYAKIGKIEIGDNCFIGENSTILPGVTIGSNVIIAAGSVVNKNISSNSCIAGVPARIYAKFDETLKRNIEEILCRPVFKYSELRSKEDLDEGTMSKIIKAVSDGKAYVKGKEKSKYDYLIWNR